MRPHKIDNPENWILRFASFGKNEYPFQIDPETKKGALEIPMDKDLRLRVEIAVQDSLHLVANYSLIKEGQASKDGTVSFHWNKQEGRFEGTPTGFYSRQLWTVEAVPKLHQS